MCHNFFHILLAQEYFSVRSWAMSGFGSHCCASLFVELHCRQALFFPLRLHSKGKCISTQIKWLLYLENSHRFIVPCGSFRKEIFKLRNLSVIFLRVPPSPFPPMPECPGQDRSVLMLLCMPGSGNS